MGKRPQQVKASTPAQSALEPSFIQRIPEERATERAKNQAMMVVARIVLPSSGFSPTWFRMRDYRIINWLAEEFKKETNIDLKNDKMALQRLKEAAEKAKHELSSVTQLFQNAKVEPR